MIRVALLVLILTPTLVASEDSYRLPPADEVTQGHGETGLSRSPQLFVREIRVTGVTALDAEEIAALVAPFTNRTLATEDLQALRHALSQRYLDEGYVNSGVTIPDQDGADGVLELVAVEGKLTRIEIQSDTKLADHYLKSRIDRHVSDPLKVGDLQYALQWLQLDRNVVRLDARLVPGDDIGQATLRVAVEEPPRFGASLRADNYRSSSVGSERGVATASVRNLTGFGEELALSRTLADGGEDASGTFEMPFTRWNTRLHAYYSRSDAKIIEKTFEALDIESVTDTRGVAFTQPLFERLEDTLTLSLGFEAKHSETELLGLPFSFSPGARDGVTDTSAALLGLEYSNRGSNHVATARATLRHGLDVLDATIFDPQSDLEALQNPTGADAEFDAVLLQGLYLYRLNQMPWLSALPDRGQLVVRSAAQLAQDPLMSLEKIAIGGANTVRGYPENLLVRDNAVAATLELQLPIPGYRAEPHPLNLVLAPFIDYGTSWDEVDTDLVSSTRNTDETRTILGTGIGLIWLPFDGFNAQVYWGHDLADDFDGDDPRDTSNGDDARAEGVHFEASYTLEL